MYPIWGNISYIEIKNWPMNLWLREFHIHVHLSNYKTKRHIRVNIKQILKFLCLSYHAKQQEVVCPCPNSQAHCTYKTKRHMRINIKQILQFPCFSLYLVTLLANKRPDVLHLFLIPLSNFSSPFLKTLRLCLFWQEKVIYWSIYFT